jgi:hypothetical protein
LGGEYVSTFLAPDVKLANQIREIITERLGIKYLVLAIGDHYSVENIRNMKKTVITNQTFKHLYLGLQHLLSSQWLDLIEEMNHAQEPFDFLANKHFAPLIEAVLDPNPDVIAKTFPEDLQPFFKALYADERYTDLVWLNLFRILSSRMGRENMFWRSFYCTSQSA